MKVTVTVYFKRPYSAPNFDSPTKVEFDIVEDFEWEVDESGALEFLPKRDDENTGKRYVFNWDEVLYFVYS